MIDLRSDTVTRPTPAMLEAMMAAKVGDDVFHEDPTVNELQEKAAALFGKEAALFCPSGTMTNQIAIRTLTQPGDEVICYSGSHVYRYEGGGMALNSSVSVRLLEAEFGILDPDQIPPEINPPDEHFPVTSTVVLENTVNKGGGSYYTIDQVREIAQVARKHDLWLHLDGARFFNALAETGESPKDHGKHFDTISICLSKGLGAPVGSLLIGSRERISKALRIRKFMGGGMRQAGFLAAAGIYALDHHRERLIEDHERARRIASELVGLSYVEDILPVKTNILIFTLKEDIEPAAFLNKLTKAGIQAVGFGKRDIRLVTHLDFDDDQLTKAVKILKNLKV
ncbi:MAG: GntG family PLP-dependent aldolase [Oceanospirillum sp.]|nr:GntG family PLP-dependent aldolase [Oceanospirillum sp.]